MTHMTEAGGVDRTWNPKNTGCWRVLCTDPVLGEMPLKFPPELEEVAHWVASNHGVLAVWHEPTDSSKEV